VRLRALIDVRRRLEPLPLVIRPLMAHLHGDRIHLQDDIVAESNRAFSNDYPQFTSTMEVCQNKNHTLQIDYVRIEAELIHSLMKGLWSKSIGYTVSA
jgi:hypothetical protein